MSHQRQKEVVLAREFYCVVKVCVVFNKSPPDVKIDSVFFLVELVLCFVAYNMEAHIQVRRSIASRHQQRRCP